MEACAASAFTKRIKEENWDKLRKSGIVPVNDIFKPYFNSIERYQVYYGSRGSGKSRFIPQKLVNQCITHSYFKCIYVRKGRIDIKESMYDVLRKVISEHGLLGQFRFNESTLKITHVPTGNCFIAKGMDDPEKSKSIEEPTCTWCEEATELEQEDFVTLDQNLRTRRGALQSIVSFNPIHEEHWLRTFFFSEDNPHAPHPRFDDIAICRSTLWNNPFIDREKYAKSLIAAACGNQNIIRVVVEGDWGQTENGNPWLYSLDTKKHFKDVPFLPAYPIYISFDFNNDPFACTIRQSSPQLGEPNSFIHYIDEIVGQHKIEDTCQMIKTRYPSSIIYITGDRSGNNDDLGRNQTLYQMIAGMLGLNKKQVITNSSNLLHSESRLLCNVMFEHHPNLYISPKCVQLRKDCEKATVDSEHRLPSQLKKDREHFKMDTFDAMRYDFQTHFNDWAKRIYSKLIK